MYCFFMSLCVENSQIVDKLLLITLLIKKNTSIKEKPPISQRFNSN